jgi:hypothetical protein
LQAVAERDKTAAPLSAVHSFLAALPFLSQGRRWWDQLQWCVVNGSFWESVNTARTQVCVCVSVRCLRKLAKWGSLNKQAEIFQHIVYNGYLSAMKLSWIAKVWRLVADSKTLSEQVPRAYKIIVYLVQKYLRRELKIIFKNWTNELFHFWKLYVSLFLQITAKWECNNYNISAWKFNWELVSSFGTVVYHERACQGYNSTTLRFVKLA